MISFGQELYDLTLRDLQTLRLEPFFRTVVTPAAGPGAATVGTNFIMPKDRAFYLAGWGMEWNAGVLGTISIVELSIQNTDIPSTITTLQRFHNGATDLLGDNRSSGSSADTVAINRTLNVLLPPQINVNIGATRVGTANASVAPSFWLFGWLIPVANLGRSF